MGEVRGYYQYEEYKWCQRSTEINRKNDR